MTKSMYELCEAVINLLQIIDKTLLTYSGNYKPIHEAKQKVIDCNKTRNKHIQNALSRCSTANDILRFCQSTNYFSVDAFGNFHIYDLSNVYPVPVFQYDMLYVSRHGNNNFYVQQSKRAFICTTPPFFKKLHFYSENFGCVYRPKVENTEEIIKTKKFEFREAFFFNYNHQEGLLSNVQYKSDTLKALISNEMI